MQKEKIIAVIPAFNEEKYISEIVKKTKKYVDEVIVVDDASTDKTSEIAKNNGAIIIKHLNNLGLGASLKTGCDAALLLDSDIIITIDGDGQHDPEEIPKLLEKMKQNNSDIIFGIRKFNKNMPISKKLGNIFLSLILNKMYNININDTQTGFRIFTKDAYKKIKWKSSDYSVSSEIAINVKKNKLNYSLEEIKTIYYEKQKGTGLIDGIRITNNILNLRASG